jgi:cystathionine beta-lyase/cystathionine gamma-synthase
MKKELKISTILAHYGEEREQHNGAVVPPIYQNSLFTFKDWDSIDKAFSDPINNCVYSRGNNPSAMMVEKKIAKIANGEKARLFSSGMGAITAAIMHCIKSGDHIITLNNIYGPASTFIKRYLKNKINVESTFVSGESIEEIKNAIKENTTLIYLECPTSAVFTIQDLEAIAKIAKQKGIKTIVDNTWATPVFQKTLDMGIDLEVHSCSKYLGGHSDIVAGVVIGNKENIESIRMNESILYGGKIAPFEAWLLMRSLRTLEIRVKQHQYNAMKVAEFLDSHPKINEVKYPG